jgi:dTDP-glucose 4,6-dehydratase
VIRHLLAATPHEVVSLDALTYAGNLENLADVMAHERPLVRARRHPRRELVRQVVAEVDVIVNAAAESHVEKSIEEGAREFVTTNVEGRRSCSTRSGETPVERFFLVSSSEVYGTAEYAPMDEAHPLQPAQPVRGDEGRRRPARVLVLDDVRAADRDRPALQQLRARASTRRR